MVYRIALITLIFFPACFKNTESDAEEWKLIAKLEIAKWEERKLPKALTITYVAPKIKMPLFPQLYVNDKGIIYLKSEDSNFPIRYFDGKKWDRADKFPEEYVSSMQEWHGNWESLGLSKEAITNALMIDIKKAVDYQKIIKNMDEAPEWEVERNQEIFTHNGIPWKELKENQKIEIINTLITKLSFYLIQENSHIVGDEYMGSRFELVIYEDPRDDFYHGPKSFIQSIHDTNTAPRLFFQSEGDKKYILWVPLKIG